MGFISLRAKVIIIKTRKPTLSLVGLKKKYIGWPDGKGVSKRDEKKG